METKRSRVLQIATQKTQIFSQVFLAFLYLIQKNIRRKRFPILVLIFKFLSKLLSIKLNNKQITNTAQKLAVLKISFIEVCHTSSVILMGELPFKILVLKNRIISFSKCYSSKYLKISRKQI